MEIIVKAIDSDIRVIVDDKTTEDRVLKQGQGMTVQGGKIELHELGVVPNVPDVFKQTDAGAGD